MLRSLSGRIYLAFVILVTLSLVVVGFLLGGRSRRDAEQTLEQRLQNETSATVFLARSFLSSSLTSAELDATANPTSQVLIIDRSGTLRYSRPPAVSVPSELQGGLAGLATAGARTDPGTGAALLFQVAPVTASGQTIGAVRIALPAAGLNAGPKRIAAAFAILGTILLGGATLLFLWLSRSIDHALDALVATARRIASGQLTERAGAPDVPELEPLANAVNEMAASLEAQVRGSLAERDTLGVVLDSMADALLVVDANGVITLANPAAIRLFALNDARLAGRRLMEVVRDHEVLRLVDDSVAQGRHTTSQIEYGRDPRLLRITATPLQQNEGHFTLVLAQDLTELQRLEAVRRDFVANASHELRTPLAAVKAVVETLEDGALEDPLVARDFLRRIGAEVDHMTALVQQFLDLSRLETGRAHLDLQPLDLRTVLPEAVNRLRPQAERQGVRLAMSLPPDLPIVLADRAGLHEIILNLVGNALKFAPRGEVELGARAAGPFVEIRVRDNGPGIGAEHLPHIFERFYKVDRARSGAPGTGLGLAIAKHMVQALGGQVWAESQIGKGSTFYFTLPIAPGTPAPRTPQA